MVHVKGFASHLDFSDDVVQGAADAMIACLRDRAARAAPAALVVAWDGDDLGDASFTRVVLRAHREVGVGLVAFKYAAERPALETSWADWPVECFLVDEPPEGWEGCRYARLGLAALATTGAAEALCLGGGRVVLDELRGLAKLPPPARRFRLFPVARPRPCGGEPELLDADGAPELVVVAADARPPPPALAEAAPPRLANPDVVVKLSRLAGAGLGLFAARRFAVGEVLLDYAGDVLETSAALALGDKSYLMRLGASAYVDARLRTDVTARYINDARDARVHNVTFRKLPHLKKAEVVVSRPVAPGDEFYASYGKLYWLGLDMQGKPSAKLPEDQVRALVAKEAEFWDGDRAIRPPPPPSSGAPG